MECSVKTSYKSDSKMMNNEISSKLNETIKPSQLKNIFTVTNSNLKNGNKCNMKRKWKARPIAQLLQIIDGEVPIHELPLPSDDQQQHDIVSDTDEPTTKTENITAAMVISTQESLTPSNAAEYQEQSSARSDVEPANPREKSQKSTKSKMAIEDLLQKEEKTTEVEPQTTETTSSAKLSLNEIHDFLDQVEKTDEMLLHDAKQMKLRTIYKEGNGLNIDEYDGDKSSSLEVTMLRQALQERTAHVHLLKDALYRTGLEKTETLAKVEKEHRAAIHKLKSDNEFSVKKLQDTASKLLGDKRQLMEKVESLLHQLRNLDSKHQIQIQTLQQRHTVDMERVKQFATVAEKVRRDRWVERQTARIKDLTVKGLEPELTRMNLQHENTVAQIQSAHAAELREQAENAAHQLHQLQVDMTRERDEELERLRAILTDRFNRQLDDERAANEKRCERLAENAEAEMARNRAAWIAQQECALKLAQQEVQQVRAAFEQQIAHLKEQHRAEIEVERQKMLDEQQKCMAAQSREYEAKLDVKFKEMRIERDAEIERAIEQHEKDEKEARAELEIEMENKIKRLKDQHMEVIADREFSNTLLKSRVSDLQSALEDVEKQLLACRTSEGRLREELYVSMQRVECLEAEQSRVREQVHLEFASRLTELEASVQHQKAKRRSELDQVHARLKTILEKKAECIFQLKKQITEANTKCLRLENLLTQQKIK